MADKNGVTGDAIFDTLVIVGNQLCGLSIFSNALIVKDLKGFWINDTNVLIATNNLLSDKCSNAVFNLLHEERFIKGYGNNCFRNSLPYH
ncbi:hypothetical protein H6F74_22325 [Trichocoleus sp. FACHB-90]|uniref:hypothetical protein n=1 Tax=Cyanophyceae TaxID=3028117 RepID=UPI001686BD70|nr:hypothetical protein [Trichocoleus sp. FACHB-90]MBD1928961.1 hypothetical protein [Trichocoleus sp. FACHB-90]